MRERGVGWEKVAAIPPNLNSGPGTSPTELMFARKIKSGFFKIQGGHEHQ